MHQSGLCPNTLQEAPVCTVLWAGCSTGLFRPAARWCGEFRGNKSKRRWPGWTHSSMFRVSSVFRGVIDSHCPRPPGTSWSHGTSWTSRCPRSVHFLALPQSSSNWERRLRGLLRKPPSRQPSEPSSCSGKYPKHCPGLLRQPHSTTGGLSW